MEELLKDKFVDRKVDMEKYRAIEAISIFTQKIRENQDNTESMKKKIINLKLSNKDFKCNPDSKEYEYIMNENRNIPFEMLSDCFMNPEIVYELTSCKRKNNCHIKARELVREIPGSILHTGWAYNANFKFLHSVVEAPNGKIIDWTKNLIISKENFFDLWDFELIESLSHDKIVKDYDNEFINNVGVSSKFYLTFRDELMADLKRKKLIADDDQER